MSKTSSHQKFFFFFLYDLSKGLRNGVVSIPLSSSIPSAILNDGILSYPIPFHEITKYDTSFSV
jgi:hypothetical protein